MENEKGAPLARVEGGWLLVNEDGVAPPPSERPVAFQICRIDRISLSGAGPRGRRAYIDGCSLIQSYDDVMRALQEERQRVRDLMKRQDRADWSPPAC